MDHNVEIPIVSAKVLLVDDEFSLVESLKGGLETRGYTVLTALDGVSAVDVARREIPHLILLDLTLPKLDGYQVLKLLKADEQCRKIPVLVITARSDAQGLVSTLDCGADSYYVKPLKFDTLLTLIQTLLVRKGHPEPAA